MTNHWNMSAPPPHPGYSHHPHTVTSHSYMTGGVPTPPIAGGPPQMSGMSHMTSGSSKPKHSSQSQNSGQFGVSEMYSIQCS